MNNDTTALLERVAEELYYDQHPEGRHRSEWPAAVYPDTVHECRDLAAAVLPIIRAAQADALETAEYRATRAEAQSETRRINTEYWRETALQERGAALDALEQIKAREARIGRLENRTASETARANEWRRKHRVMAGKRDAAHRAYTEEREARRAAEARIKAVRELHQQSALIRHVPRFMREGHDDDQPFHYCTGCDGARYPCATTRALEGDA